MTKERWTLTVKMELLRRVNADNSFDGKATVAAGNNTITVMATDLNGNTATNRSM